MKKQLTSKTVYEPNEKVKVTVTNKPVVDEETGERLGYNVTVTTKHSVGISDKELKFTDDESISKYLENIDTTDPQTSLFGDGGDIPAPDNN